MGFQVLIYLFLIIDSVNEASILWYCARFLVSSAQLVRGCASGCSVTRDKFSLNLQMSWTPVWDKLRKKLRVLRNILTKLREVKQCTLLKVTRSVSLESETNAKQDSPDDPPRTQQEGISSTLFRHLFLFRPRGWQEEETPWERVWHFYGILLAYV